MKSRKHLFEEISKLETHYKELINLRSLVKDQANENLVEIKMKVIRSNLEPLYIALAQQEWE